MHTLRAKNRSLKSLLPLVLVFSLSGCLGEVPRKDLAEAPKDMTPELEMAPKLAPYLLQVGDVLDVKLMMNPELNDQMVVRPDGMISTMVAGDIKAYGRTVRQVQKDLTREYSRNLSNPQVSLILRSFAPTRVYVTGEVNNSGEFIGVGPTLTLMQAIARAGGVKNSADTDNLVIIRHGAGDTVKAYKANYHLAATGEDPSADIRLAPYDVVYVPRHGAANAYLNYQQYFQQFLPISGNVGATYTINPINVH